MGYKTLTTRSEPTRVTRSMRQIAVTERRHIAPKVTSSSDTFVSDRLALRVLQLRNDQLRQLICRWRYSTAL